MDDRKASSRAPSHGWVRRRRRVRIYDKGISLKWFIAILAAALLASLLLIAFGGLFENLDDKTYRPKDIERKYHEMQRMKEAAEKQPSPSSGR